MTQPLSPEALAWLRQSDLVDGSTYSRALLHLLERVEALEARPIPASPARPAPGPQSAPAIFPVEYADFYDSNEDAAEWLRSVLAQPEVSQ